MLDGEICALDERGRSRFSLLQEGGGTPVLVLFDLLELESQPVLDEPFAERRKRLEELVSGDGGVVVSPQFDDGPALLAAASDQELEGVVAKRADSPYRPGKRSVDWHKLKLRRTQEVVVVGYTKGQGRRAGFGALVAGVHDAGALRWAGNVGNGLLRSARSSGSALSSRRSSAPSRPSTRCRRCLAYVRRMSCGSSRSSSPRSSSPSGRTRVGCVRPRTCDSATTRRRPRCVAST